MPYKRGKKWMAQIRINGQLKRKTFLTKTEAKEWEVSQRKKTPEQIPCRLTQNAPEIATASLIEWAEDYLDFSKVKHSAKTYDEKKGCFRKFLKLIDPGLPTNRLTSGHVLQYLQLQAQSRSGNAANKDRKNLVAAWNWGIKYKSFPNNNPCLVDRFPEIHSPRYVPPEDDFWKVFSTAETDQDEVMLLTYLNLAARRSELFSLRWDDINLPKKTVHLFTRKNKDGSVEFSELPLTDDLYNALESHYGHRDSEWVFPDPKTGLPYLYRQRWMERLCQKARIKKFGIHGIRHLTASILAQKNVPMIDIQTILRHKNLSTTERYIRRLGSVRSAINMLPGKKAHKHKNKLTERKKGNQL